VVVPEATTGTPLVAPSTTGRPGSGRVEGAAHIARAVEVGGLARERQEADGVAEVALGHELPRLALVVRTRSSRWKAQPSTVWNNSSPRTAAPTIR